MSIKKININYLADNLGYKKVLDFFLYSRSSLINIETLAVVDTSIGGSFDGVIITGLFVVVPQAGISQYSNLWFLSLFGFKRIKNTFFKFFFYFLRYNQACCITPRSARITIRISAKIMSFVMLGSEIRNVRRIFIPPLTRPSWFGLVFRPFIFFTIWISFS